MLEYIESTGTQYIDTEYIAKSENYKVNCKFSISELSTTAVLFGGGASTDVISIMAQNPAKIYVGGGRIIKDTIYFNVGQIHEMDCHANNGTFSIVFDGTTYSEAYTSTINKEYSLVLFGNNISGNVSAMCKARIYSFQIYDNDVLVRDYIPALRSDGIAGLYDAVNDTFYVSSGTGNFVAGGDSAQVIATQTSVTGTYKIPYGVAYTVKASDVSSYITPALYGKTADTPTNVVPMRYVYNTDPGITNPTNGIWIQSTDGKYYTSENWLSNKTPNGIAVITSNCRFVVALENAIDPYCNWGGYGTLIDGIVTTESELTAIKDYDGKGNTECIVNELGEDIDYAAKACKDYTFPNGAKGYLGAAGEWNEFSQNKEAVISAIRMLGYEIDEEGLDYWTSTQYDSVQAYCLAFDGIGLVWHYKGTARSARAFTLV